jgi:hypothetical protein
MIIRLTIFLFEIFNDRFAIPRGNKYVEISFGYSLPFFYSARMRAEKNVYFKSQSFKKPLVLLKIAFPELILIRYCCKKVNQLFF